jgi:hypothetical protein
MLNQEATIRLYLITTYGTQTLRWHTVECVQNCYYVVTVFAKSLSFSVIFL